MYKKPQKVYISEKHVYKTAKNVHIPSFPVKIKSAISTQKTLQSRAKTLQKIPRQMLHCNKMCNKLHKPGKMFPTIYKGPTMYDFFKPIELSKTYQQTEKAVKDAYHFWLDVAIDTIKMLKAK